MPSLPAVPVRSTRTDCHRAGDIVHLALGRVCHTMTPEVRIDGFRRDDDHVVRARLRRGPDARRQGRAVRSVVRKSAQPEARPSGRALRRDARHPRPCRPLRQRAADRQPDAARLAGDPRAAALAQQRLLGAGRRHRHEQGRDRRGPRARRHDDVGRPLGRRLGQRVGHAPVPRRARDSCAGVLRGEGRQTAARARDAGDHHPVRLRIPGDQVLRVRAQVPRRVAARQVVQRSVTGEVSGRQPVLHRLLPGHGAARLPRHRGHVGADLGGRRACSRAATRPSTMCRSSWGRCTGTSSTWSGSFFSRSST